MHKKDEISKEYALLCGEMSNTIDYLEDLITRLKATMNEAEELYISDNDSDTPIEHRVSYRYRNKQYRKIMLNRSGKAVKRGELKKKVME